MTIVRVICGWCREEFETENQRSSKIKAYPTRICPHCGREVAASRIELTDNAVGRRHIHSPSIEGDIV